MRKRQLLGLVSAMAFSQFAGGQVTTWTNQSGDNSWTNPANWNNGVPVASGEALVPLAGTQIDLGGAIESVGLLRFSAAGGAQLNNGKLRANEILSIGATSTLSINVGLVAAGPELALRSNTANFLSFFGDIDDATGMSSDLRLVNARLFGAVRTSGPMHVNVAVSTLSSSATLLNPSSINVNSGALVLSETTNAIPDTVPVRLRRGSLSFVTLASDFVERVGTISLLQGNNGIGLGTGTANPRVATLRASSLVRDDLATLVVNRSQVDDMRVKFDQPVTNFGGGTLLPQRAMLPWAVTNAVGDGREYAFMTYDSGPNPSDPSDDIGLRPLNPDSEQRSGFAGVTSFDNVRLTTSTTVSTPTEIQSLTISSPGGFAGIPSAVLTLNAPLTIRSGGVLGTGTNSMDSRLNQIDGTGSIHVPGDAFISESIAISGPHQLRIMVPLHANRIVMSGNNSRVRLSDARAQKIIMQGFGTIDSAIADEIDVLGGGLTIGGNFSGALRLQDGATFTTSGTSFAASVHFEPPSIDRALISPSRYVLAMGSTAMTGSITGAGSFQFNGLLRHFGDATFEYAEIIGNCPFEVNGTWRATSGELVLNQTDSVNRAILRGTGTFLGDVFGGWVEPGQNAIGRLTISSYAARGLNSQMTFVLGGLEPSSGYDQLRVLDAISLEEGATEPAELRVQLQFTPPMGSEFTLIDNQGLLPISGRFLNLSEGALFNTNSSTFAITYFGGDGNDVVVTVVPEPIAALPAAALMLHRRRRSK